MRILTFLSLFCLLFSCKSKCSDIVACATFEPSTEDLGAISCYQVGNIVRFLHNGIDTLVFKVEPAVFYESVQDHRNQIDCHPYYVSCNGKKVKLSSTNSPFVFEFLVDTWRRADNNKNYSIQEACSLSINQDSSSTLGLGYSVFGITDFVTDSLLHGTRLQSLTLSNTTYTSVYECNYKYCSTCLRFWYSKDKGLLKLVTKYGETFEYLSN